MDVDMNMSSEDHGYEAGRLRFTPPQCPAHPHGKTNILILQASRDPLLLRLPATSRTGDQDQDGERMAIWFMFMFMMDV